VRCPKCKKESGDSWSQCEGSCPMPMSPHYDSSRPDALTTEQMLEVYKEEQRTKVPAAAP
jgi:hypothetical protein